MADAPNQKQAAPAAPATEAARPQLRHYVNEKTSLRADTAVDGIARVFGAVVPQMDVPENSLESFTKGYEEFRTVCQAISDGTPVDFVGAAGTIIPAKPRKDCVDGRFAILSTVDYPTDYKALAKFINDATAAKVKALTQEARDKYVKPKEGTVVDLSDKLA